MLQYLITELNMLYCIHLAKYGLLRRWKNLKLSKRFLPFFFKKTNLSHTLLNSCIYLGS